MSATQPEVQNTQLVILNGTEDQTAKILGEGYQLEKSFTKNQQGVYILERITSD